MFNMKYYKASKIQWPDAHGQSFSDTDDQMITKLQCNLQYDQWLSYGK